MKISIFTGDITEAPADAICTSTNPRLSLMMGTGGEVRDRGGFEVLRACEHAIAEHKARTGETQVPPGSAHLTTAGRLPYKAIIHCVASDRSHHSSAEIVRSCVTNALGLAAAAGCATVAMPIFASGHAALKFEQSLAAMAETLKSSTSPVDHVIVVLFDADREDEARTILRRIAGDRLQKKTLR